MARKFSRRSFLVSAGAGLGTKLLGAGKSAEALHLLLPAQQQQSAANGVTLQAVMRSVEVDGRAATVMGLLQPNGAQGLTSTVNQPFDVTLENKLSVPTAIHWHGLHPPNNQDGVPGLTQQAVRPDTSTKYNFPLQPAGTHWMHSHQGLQEAFLLSAPLIVHDSSDR
jgi:FtsP/CotA-like multicopper oxidase with cupredoxin domain